jgi:hypothetical protein
MRQNIIATDPEIKDMKKKIESSYVTKERAKQLAEKQVRTLESKIKESEIEADMLIRGQRAAELKEL